PSSTVKERIILACIAVSCLLQFPSQFKKGAKTTMTQRRNWKQLPRDKTRPQHASPYAASINPKGTISISLRTWQNMGEPEAFSVLFDERNNCLGLEPTT